MTFVSLLKFANEHNVSKMCFNFNFDDDTCVVEVDGINFSDFGLLLKYKDVSNEITNHNSSWINIPRCDDVVDSPDDYWEACIYRYLGGVWAIEANRYHTGCAFYFTKIGEY